MFAVLFYFAPNVKMPSFRWVSAGALVAIVLWLVASAAFAFYVANFGSYDKTYGTLGGVVALLVWFWITNWRCCSAWSSTPSASAVASWTPACPARTARSSSSPLGAQAPEDHLAGSQFSPMASSNPKEE